MKKLVVSAIVLLCCSGLALLIELLFEELYQIRPPRVLFFLTVVTFLYSWSVLSAKLCLKLLALIFQRRRSL